MNLFKIPISLINKLHWLCAQFWWGGDPEKKRMHWCTWENLCVHKADGGMGFRDLSKIGSWEDTFIYHDGWLPRDGVFKISSPRVLGIFDKVSSLITASGLWDSSLIRASFHPDEAEAILSFPLPRRKLPDSFLWHYDKSGHYTVCSKYWLATKRKSVPSSSTSFHTSWWKKFWRLRIPPKIRIFLWKAYYNWIPSLVNLAKHGTLESLKVLCDSSARFKLPPQCDLKEFLLTANDCLSLENLEFLCVLLWRIWFRRNKWIHEQTWLDDESWANNPWQAPTFGWVKVNSNAAWCSKQKKFGLGTIIRDFTGKVLGSVATPISSSVFVAVAESWALERGAALAKQLSFSEVVLESDCLAVTKTLDLITVIASEINYVFDSIYEICSDFHLYKFSNTQRIGNQVAHNLARLALSLENEKIWLMGIPESINHFVIVDMQQLSSS
ncbi:hypothetical protein UlMin_037015 [Ulmus minor]